MTFKDLGLNENIMKALEDCGYDTPTPIQAQAIPHVLMARDVVGLAQTGTGKTASFTLPMIEILDGGRAKARMPRSLVLAPTRELAAQVAENFETYGKYTKLTKALLTGGVSMDEQIKKLDRGVDVLIATPGRLLDLFERGRILMTDIKVFVIDEADRMLDMGFIPDIEKIVSFLPPLRQTLFFSATMSPEIKKLTAKFLSNPREVSVAPPSSSAKTVKQFLVWTTKRKKKETLLHIIKDEQVDSAFIFCNRKRDIGALTKYLRGKGFTAEEMHGDMDQKSRTKTLKAMKNGEITLLVCSDVAGRGIDVDDLSHVFNYDIPFNAEDYVHRIGRTGRAGRDGRAWSLAAKDSRDDDKLVESVEALIKKPIDVVEVGRGGQASGKSDKKDNKEHKKSSARSDNKPSKDSQAKSKSKPEGKKEDSSKSKNHNKSNKKSQNRTSKDDEDVLGFGDEVPNFFRKSG